MNDLNATHSNWLTAWVFLYMLAGVVAMGGSGCTSKPSSKPSSQVTSESNGNAPTSRSSPSEATPSPTPIAADAGNSSNTSSRKGSNRSEDNDASNVESFEKRVQLAAEKLDRGDVEEAWKSVKQLTVVQPKDPQLIFLTARVLAAKQEHALAIKTLAQIPADSPLAGPSAGQAAEWMVAQGDLGSAEQKLKALLKEYPNAVPGLRLLAKIYNAQGRRWDAFRYLDRLIRLGDFTTLELLASVDLRDYFDDEPVRMAYTQAHPSEPFVRFAVIRSKLLRNAYAQYFEELQQLSLDHPELLEPWVWTATSLLELERFDELAQWLNDKHDGAEKHPEYWYSLGGLLLENQRPEPAARSFCEAIQLDRRHVAAHQGLASALLAMGRVDEAQRVRTFGNDLVTINDLVQQISYQYGEPKLYARIASMYRALGDDVAAFGWSAIGATLGHSPMTEDLKAEQQALRKGKSTPAAVLQSLPWTEWERPSQPPRSVGRPEPSLTQTTIDGIRMEDVAATLGVTSAYQNGAKPDRSWYTIEGVGGGVGAIDYDRDGWPDLCFSEAGDSPTLPNPVYQPKTFFRSLQGKAFVEIAQQACLADVGYGQGVGVCDIDQDGFQDLMFANLGVSRIYRNNGDGTFEFRTIDQPDTQSIWNSSLHAADVNGDHLPDLLDASYIYGKEAITKWCETSNSARGSCNPKIFPPGKNRIHSSLGDWSWSMAPNEFLESIQTGYTFGTLVTNLDQREGNDVFFANDVSPNLLLTSQRDSANGQRVLVERAAAAGVAVDSIGRAQACMGISCGDQNRDGLLDIIVTNFYNEPSTLYLQTLPGVFVDGTRRSKLGTYTHDQLSFGSQFLDLDHDGWLDLVAVNGHIDDLRSENIPFHMPTQILKNERGVFRWLQSPSPGPYFDSKWIGRSLQSLDFNRDGKLDLVATHLDRPAALLENKTDSPHHFVQLELVGTQSERDATGAMLRIECGDEFWVTSVADGDGFFGSNEKLIHVGIAGHQHIDQILIQWPSGLEERYRSLDADKRYRCIEGIGIDGS